MNGRAKEAKNTCQNCVQEPILFELKTNVQHKYCVGLFPINMKGTVKFYNIDKGFGFIKEDGTDNEYHVHISGLNHQISQGDTVTFDLQEGEKGKSAINVELIL